MRWVLAMAALVAAGCPFDPIPRDHDPDAAVAVPDAVDCRAPFTASPTGCHAFPAETLFPRLSFAEARAACQNLGGDLPIIDSVDESIAVASALAANDGRRVWLGLRGAGTNGGAWTWLDGMTVATRGLSLWMAGQPVAGSGCAVVRPDNHRWAGRGCAEKMIAVCEKS